MRGLVNTEKRSFGDENEAQEETEATRGYASSMQKVNW